MDEINSSSSSSIGKEDNANYALGETSSLKKANIKHSDIQVSRLNFTGKPFAPDSVFVNSIGKSLGDEDDGAEFENVQELNLHH
jgi:hypothetical protein